MAEAPNTPQSQNIPQPPQNIVLTFCGQINPASANKLRNACSVAVNQKVQNLKILFTSTGGSIEDGFALYSFLRALPLSLTMHAIGSVESIAPIIFLGAETRLATAESHFMIHQFAWPFLAQHYEKSQIKNALESLERSQSRYIAILENRTLLTKQYLDGLNAFEKVAILSPTLAKEKGVIQEIAEPTIPAGWATYNIDL